MADKQWCVYGYGCGVYMCKDVTGQEGQTEADRQNRFSNNLEDPLKLPI